MSLSYYARIGAALFPIPYGQKNPTGLVASFARDCSTDPAVWARWEAAHPRCNWGIVAGPSGLIIIDIDVQKEGREAAWAAWGDLCRSWGLTDIPYPHVQSARGGWHVLFRVPEGVDARSLRQPDAIKGLINIRAGNGYVVAAGSFYDGTSRGEASGFYILRNANLQPYPAPTALIEHCTRKGGTGGPLANGADVEPPFTGEISEITTGSFLPDDVRGVLEWFVNREGYFSKNPGDGFYNNWVYAGMSLKAHYGAQGFPLWLVVTWDTAEAYADAIYKWGTFHGVERNIESLFHDAWEMGWKGKIRRRNGSEMFAKALAKANGLSMTGGLTELHRRGMERCNEFLAATASEPFRPEAAEWPQLPITFAAEAFYGPLQGAIARLFAMAETSSRTSLVTRAKAVLGYLYYVDKEICGAVVQRCNALGVGITLGSIRNVSEILEREVKAVFEDGFSFYTDSKNLPDARNSDNVAVFLRKIGIEVQFNAWLEQDEIRGAIFSDWIRITDKIISYLLTRGAATGMGYYPTEKFFRQVLETIAAEHTIDPARELLDQWQNTWDQVPRIHQWLSKACHIVNDAYHSGVGVAMLIAIVARIRQPGIKIEGMPVFVSAQKSKKSALARILALKEDWFLENIELGTQPKELVLLLAGKSVVEISEMRTRGEINAVKAMITATHDEGRPAYGRLPIRRARRHLFIGSTNDLHFLEDITGGKRFWPIVLEQEINTDYIEKLLPQLIGEAAHWQTQGLVPNIAREIWDAAAQHQEAVRIVSGAEELLRSWYDREGELYVRSAEVVERLARANMASSHKSIAGIMRKIGYLPDRQRLPDAEDGARIWVKSVTKKYHSGCLPVVFSSINTPQVATPQIQLPKLH